MEDHGQVDSGPALQNILEELEKLNIADDKQLELKACAKAVLALNVDKVRHDSVKDLVVVSDDVVKALIKFAGTTVSVLELFRVISPQYGTLCKVVVDVIGYVFLNDISSLILKRFCRTDAVDADFRARCKATGSKVTQCITYMQGLPRPEELDASQKQFHLQLLASDAPVDTGLDEVLVLGVKITDLLKSSQEQSFSNIMEKVQLYCCLATFRELFLLYRIAVQATFEVDATSVKNVFDVQRKHDEAILKFLYRPTVKTAKYACRYRADDDEWPIVCSFMDRRGLRAEELKDLRGAVVQIQSVHYQDRCLSVCKKRFSADEYVCCENNPNDQSTLFQLQGGIDNVFTIFKCESKCTRHLSCYSGAKLELTAGVPSGKEGLWYIQKLEPESSHDSPSYMIRLAADDSRYVYAGKMNEQVFAEKIGNFGPRHLWRLVEAEDTYFRKCGRFLK